MTETPAPSPEAVEAGARALYEKSTGTKLVQVFPWDLMREKDAWRSLARAALTAAMPLLTPASPEPVAPDECEMFHEPPMDFAYCKTHDDTFPLGGACKFQGREMWEVYAEEAQAQRVLKVRAEMELDRLRAAVAEEIAQAIEAERVTDFAGWGGVGYQNGFDRAAAIARAAARRGGETDGT